MNGKGCGRCWISLGIITGTSLVLTALVWPLCALAAEEFRYQQLYSFRSGTNDASRPIAPLIEASNGALYGTTASNKLGAVFKLQKDGTGFAVIHYFGTVAHDGAKPWHAGLIEASDGMLYGTTVFGGTNGRGTAFRMNKDGSGYGILHHFTGGNDGAEPSAEVIEGSDGMLYGTTYTGGPSGYYGTAFAMDKNGGNFRLLHRFGPGMSSDGLNPSASLLEAKDGVLYGTTLTGGGEAEGSVFKINKDGSGYLKLHTFTPPAVNPFAQLTEGSDGALYGTTFGGYSGVFKLNKDGTNYRLLSSPYAGEPYSKLVKGRDGAFYGTTFGGGYFESGGTIFRVNEDGSGYQLVHIFYNGYSPGTQARNPGAGLILGKDGAFYGTTYSGGDFNGGTVFRLLVNRVPLAQCTNLIVSAGTNCAVNVSVNNGSFDPDGDPITLRQTPPGPYPPGTNLVTLTVTDSNGSSNVCVASVVVLDTTPPTITCSSNITLEFATDRGAVVTYSVAAADYCDPNPIITSAPASGSTFPIGVSEVHSTAVDASSNSASCSFTVTVLGARGVKSNVLAELIAVRTGITCAHDQSVCGKLDDAIGYLQTCLHSGLWIDETHIQRSGGKQVFQDEAHAIEKLCQLLNGKKTDLPDSLLQDWINRLTRADRLLASVAINEALAAGVSQRKTDQAQSFLQSGDAQSAGGKCGGGIEDYRNAWKFAAQPQITLPAQSSDRRVRLEITSAPGDQITIQASSNLTDWLTIAVVTADADGTITFEDPDAATYSTRYYRCFSN